jgi:hypothetical protein
MEFGLEDRSGGCDVVVGVVRTDLGFELVVEPEGVKRY